MTNDERNPKPECPNALSCVVARFVIRISSFLRISSFVIRVSELRFMERARPNEPGAGPHHEARRAPMHHDSTLPRPAENANHSLGRVVPVPFPSLTPMPSNLPMASAVFGS